MSYLYHFSLKNWMIDGVPRAHPLFSWTDLLSPIATIGSALLGGAFSSSNTNSTNAANAEAVNATNQWNARNVDVTNAANLQIAQMSNQYNERMFNKQLQYNWDMWNANNQYNSASAQRQRWEEAGFNPYMMAGNSNAGVSQSSGSTNPPSAAVPQMQAAQAQSPRFENNASNIASVFNSLGQAASMFSAREAEAEKSRSEKDLLDSQKTNQDIQNRYAALNLAAQYENLLAGAEKTRSETAYHRYLTDIGRATFSDDVSLRHFQAQGQNMQNLYLEAQTDFMKIQSDIQRLNLKWLPIEKRANLALLQAQITEQLSRGQLNKAQASELVSRSLLNEANIEKVKADKKVIDKTTRFIVNEAAARAWRADAENKNMNRFGTPTYQHYVDGGYRFAPLFGLFGSATFNQHNQFKK